MEALAKFTGRLFGRNGTSHVRLPEPDPINAKPRPMTGFIATLTPEQRKAALAYRGPEGHGDPAFLLRR
jgi:hypothetical protein